MKRLALICFLFISVLSAIKMQAQSALPLHEGESRQYSAYIEMSRGYISGVCVLLKKEETINGCLFNEFGITSLEFTYYPNRKKVKLHHIIKIMDKWYIRQTIRKDLVHLIHSLEKGYTKYHNERRNITYQLNPIENEVSK